MAVTISDLEKLAYSIKNAVSTAVKAGAKSVVVPERQKFVKEIKKDLETGQIEKVEGVIDRLSNTIDDLGTDLESYGDVLKTEVVENLKDLVKQKKESELEVDNLRKQGLVAQVRATEKNNQIIYKATLFKKKEIKARHQEVYKKENEILKQEKELQKDIIKYQKGPEDEEKAQKLLERKEKISVEKEKIMTDKEKLGDKEQLSFLDELKENIPDSFSDMFSTFKDTLMAPIQAVKNLGKVIGDMGKGIMKTVKLFGTLAKGLGRLVLSVMSAVGSFLVAALPFIAIGAAIIALGYGLYKLGQKLGIFDEEPEFRSDAEKSKFTEIKNKADADKPLTSEEEDFLVANPHLAKYGGQKTEDIAFKQTQKYEEIQNRGDAGDLAGEAAMIYDDEYAQEFLQSDKTQKSKIQKFKEGQQILFEKGYTGGDIVAKGQTMDLEGFKRMIMEDRLSMEDIKGATVVNVDNSKTDNSSKSGTNITTNSVVTDPSLDSMYSTTSP